MTNITFNHPPTAELSGLQTASSGGKFIVLQWIIPPDIDYFATEIWVSTTNNRASATLYAKETSNSFRYPAIVGDTRYFWIRPIDVYGYSVNNPFHPVSATSGVVGTLQGVSTDNLEANSVSALVVLQGVGVTAAATGGASPTFPVYDEVFLMDKTFFPTYPASTARLESNVRVSTLQVVGEWTAAGGGTMTLRLTTRVETSPTYIASTGKITLTNGSATVTGVGCNFQTAWDYIQTFNPPGFPHMLVQTPYGWVETNIRPSSQNSFTITSSESGVNPWPGATLTGVRYAYPSLTSRSLVGEWTSNITKYRKQGGASYMPLVTENATHPIGIFNVSGDKVYFISASLRYDCSNVAAHCSTIVVDRNQLLVTEFRR